MAIEIATAEDLYNVRNNLQADYIQVSDIDLSGYSNWEPIGNEDTFVYDDPTTHFSLNYDGQDYKITGLTINKSAENYIGLFGNARCRNDNSVESTIKNVNLVNVDIKGQNYVGSLFGNIDFSYTSGGTFCRINIENCSASGIVRGEDGVGGLLGGSYLNLTIDNSEFDGDVFGDNGSYVGGFIGSFSSAVEEPSYIKNSNSKGSVTANSYIGGFVGFFSSDGIETPNIDNCYSESSIYIYDDTSFCDEIGGFVGEAQDGYIYNCHASGNIYGIKTGTYSSWAVGGFLGWGRLAWETNSKIEKCYSTGTIIGGEDVGGFLGSLECVYQGVGQTPLVNCYTVSSIESNEMTGSFMGSLDANDGNPKIVNCYSTGPMNVNIIDDYTAGFCGNVYSSNGEDFQDCYYDSDVTGFDDENTALPRTTSEMTYEPASNTYLNWDFDNVWNIYPADVANDGYPVFEIYEIPDTNIYFIEEPKINKKQPQANVVTVTSPTAEYTETLPNLSKDDYVERLIEIDEGDSEVCQVIAEKLLENWSKELTAVEGTIRLRQNLNFKQKVKVTMPAENFEDRLVLQKNNHDIIEQETKITAGDLILSDNELLSRLLADLN